MSVHESERDASPPGVTSRTSTSSWPTTLHSAIRPKLQYDVLAQPRARSVEESALGGNAGSGSGVVAGGVRASPSREPYLTLSPMVAVVEAQLGEAGSLRRPPCLSSESWISQLKWMVEKRFNPPPKMASHILD